MTTHAWCEICADGDVPHEVHEAPVVKIPGIPSGVTANPRVLLQLNYVDGERGPRLYVGSNNAELTVEGAEQLHRELGEQIRLMRTVQPTPLAVTR